MFASPIGPPLPNYKGEAKPDHEGTRLSTTVQERPDEVVKRTTLKMVQVYRYGQDTHSDPAFTITREEAEWWFRSGAVYFGEDPGVLGQKVTRKGRVKFLILSKPTSDRMKLRSGLGAQLTFAVLAGRTESVACAAAFRHVTTLGYIVQFCSWPRPSI